MRHLCGAATGPQGRRELEVVQVNAGGGERHVVDVVVVVVVGLHLVSRVSAGGGGPPAGGGLPSLRHQETYWG